MARALRDDVIMDAAAAPVHRELAGLVDEMHARIDEFHALPLLWPENLRRRNQIEERRTYLMESLEITQFFFNQNDTVQERLAGELQEAGFSEQQIDGKLRQLAERGKVFAGSEAYAKAYIRLAKIELELLELYDSHFGEWYTDAQGYAVFKSPQAHTQFINILERSERANERTSE
ncbi:MAG: hypothetical protein AAF333_09780 [Planctomycetota bacterium]